MSDHGKCGIKTYPNITQEIVNGILAALKKNGATVSGNNPWDVDTHKYGVKLRGTWDSSTQVLSIIVTGKDFFVPCHKIWDTINNLIPHLQSLSTAEIEEGVKAL